MTTSASDVTFFLASDGREWGDYCAGVVGSFTEITYTLLEVDKYDQKKPPDVTSAWCQSPVWVLLATSQLLRCLRETWLSSLLNPPPAASTVVVVTIDDDQNVQEVFGHPEVTSHWTVLDCGQREDELRKMMVALLNIIETNQRPQSKADVAMKLYPENIREPGTSIAIVFSQEVTNEVKVVVGSGQECPVSPFNSCVLTFKAPVMPPGTYDVSVMVGCQTLHSALTYLQVDRRTLDSCHFLRQCVAMSDHRTLDRYLADTLMLCQDRVKDIFLSRQGLYRAQRKLFPTSIHFAAANGLSEFCSALMHIPGGREASKELNCDNNNAACLALQHDFTELAAKISKLGTVGHLLISKSGEPVDTANSGYVSMGSPVRDDPPPPPCLPRVPRWSSEDPATMGGKLPLAPRLSSDNTRRDEYTRPQFGSVPDMSVLVDHSSRPAGGFRNPGVMIATSPAHVPKQHRYLQNKRTHLARSKTFSVEDDMYENPLSVSTYNIHRGLLHKGFSQDSAHPSREWKTSDHRVSQGSRDSGASSPRDSKSPRTPPQDQTWVTEEGRDSGVSQGSRDSGVSQGSRDSGVSQGSRDSGVPRDIKIPRSPPPHLKRDSEVSQGTRDNPKLISLRDKSPKTEKRMSYADKFLTHQTPIPPPRRRKIKVESTKL